MKRLILYVNMLCLVIGGCCYKVAGQEVYPVYSFTTREGLPSNYIYCIRNDSKNNIWIGTDKGIACYNGTNMQVYTTKDGLASNDVYNIQEDDCGRMWMLCKGDRICYYFKDSFFTVVGQNREILSPTYIYSYNKTTFIASKRTIFAYTSGQYCYDLKKLLNIREKGVLLLVNKMLYIYDEDQQKLFTYNIATKSKSAVSVTGPLFSRFTTKHGYRIWQAGNIISFETPTYFWRFFITGEKAKVIGISIKQNETRYTIDDNDIYIIANGQVRIVNIKGATKNILHLKSFFPMLHFMCDKFNNYWAITAHGLYYIPYQSIFNNWKKVYQDEFYSLVPINDSTIAGITAKGVVLGKKEHFYSLPGINKILTQGKEMPKYTLSLAQIDKSTLALLSTTNDTISALAVNISTGTPLALLKQKGDLIRGILASRTKNTAYLRTANKLVKFTYNNKQVAFDTINGVDMEQYPSYEFVKEDSVLLLGGNNGLFIDTLANNRKRMLLPYAIKSIRKFDAFYIATEYNGMYRWDGNTMMFIPGSDDGYITTFYVKDPYLIICYGSKIRIYTKDTQHKQKGLYALLKTIKISHALAVNDVIIQNGTLLLAQNDGLYQYKIEHTKQQHDTFDIAVNYIYVNDKAQNIVNDTLILSAPFRNMTVYMSHNQYENPRSDIYYSVSFNKKEQSFISKTPDIHIDKLPIGTTSVCIQGEIKNGGKPSNIICLTIIIEPQWWQTMWANILEVIIALAIIYAIIILIIRRVKKKAEQRYQLQHRLTELKLEALQSQINPHFIFNSLATVQYYIQKNSPREAQNHVAQFAKLIRSYLNFSRVKFITLKEEIEALKLYLELEKKRLRQGLEVSIHISETLNQVNYLIPSMLIQPYIENALLHGIVPSRKDSFIRINFQSQGAYIQCIIEDNGIGINESIKKKKQTNKSLGMQLMNEKIETLNKAYDINISMEAIDKSELNKELTGTIVSITWRKNEKAY